MKPRFYVTTPIYYVNDRPHIGHAYTTILADVLARYHRLWGEDVFSLTGTDEHAAKVVDSATQHNLSPQQWADRNAQAFQKTFKKLNVANDDFIRTTQQRHKDKVQQYIRELQKTGDVYLGEYEGWYDAGQEEYIPELKAKEYDFVSPFNKKPLVRKKEKNYFFKLSAYQDRLQKLLEAGEVDGQRFAVLPEARCNEVLGRIREGLNDVPISRAEAGGWGIPIPNDPEHTVYVWIDALFNYLSTVDTDERRKYWPADVHLIAKDILWFHAVIWPAMLLALKRPLPKAVYSHSFWSSDGQKMSKSLGNFVDIEKIDHYIATFGVDALRWFLATSGPWGTMDSDFSENKFIDVYNRDLANDFGNLLNRVSGLSAKNFDGCIPAAQKPTAEEESVAKAGEAIIVKVMHDVKNLQLSEALGAVMGYVQSVNKFMESQAPWKVAKTDLARAGSIIYTAAEALRITAVLLLPVLTEKSKTVLGILGAENSTLVWGQLKAGTKLQTHPPLFPRFEIEPKVKP